MGTYDNAFGGALHDPMFDAEEGCDVCWRYVDDCICPECPVCGEHGNPKCYGTHMDKSLLVLVNPLEVRDENV